MKRILIGVSSFAFLSASMIVMSQGTEPTPEGACPPEINGYCKIWTVDLTIPEYSDLHMKITHKFRIYNAATPDNPAMKIQAIDELREVWGNGPHQLYEFKRDNVHLCMAANLHLRNTHPDGHAIPGREPKHQWHQISLTLKNNELEIEWNRDSNGAPPTSCEPGPVESNTWPTHGGRAHAN